MSLVSYQDSPQVDSTEMLHASSETSPTLVNVPLDLQITICTLLHPSDILALRETCKALQLPTRQRAVWVAALHQACLDNSLFLPSFPIEDMSNVELEHAAMGPRRWIELCARFEKQYHNGFGASLRPRTTRRIKNSIAAGYEPELFIAPGGRYMVTSSHGGICVWDLGYTSGADCKLIASGGPQGRSCSCKVQATPDGMGLVIFASLSFQHCFVYEIYPQSETAQLTQIAYHDLDPTQDVPPCFLPDRVIWYGASEDKVIFRVWDYRMNHSIAFSIDVDLTEFEYGIEVIATKTVIVVLCREEILVWAIPPLSPQPLDFSDHNSAHIPPLYSIRFPDDVVNQVDFVEWRTMSHWYSGSSQPIYFDIFCRRDSKLHRFKIIVQPNLLDTSLHHINTELVPHDFDNARSQQYSICEDTLVTCWHNDSLKQWGVYNGLTESSRLTTVISHGRRPAAPILPANASVTGNAFFLCPTSGRYVYFDPNIFKIIVVDLF